MIRIITGGVGAGKAKRCLYEIEQLHKKYPSSKCLMLVNEHYSHETEKLFTEYFGGTGLNNIEVTTFKKLSRELLSEALTMSLTASGKQILLRKTTMQFLAEEPNINSNLRRAIRRDGFLDVLSQMISEMKHYNVSVEDLRKASDSINKNRALKEKMSSLARLYEIYSDNFAALKYTDGEDGMEYLADAVAYTDKLDGAYMWIDKFDELLPQQMKVVEALYHKVRQLTVSICCPASELERPLYAEVERTLRKIEMLDVEREYHDCGEHLKNIKAPELKFLLDKWDSRMVYDKKADGIKVFEARDAYSEVEHTAGQIVDLVREDGLRFKDIAVICGNEEAYQYLIDAVFDEYEIPSFSDTKIVLSDHPIAMQMLALFDIFDNDFDYTSVFRYLKSGFIYEKTKNGFVKNISANGIDELENFVLKYGIKGRSRWLSKKPWKSGETVAELTTGSMEENECRLADIKAEEERINSLKYTVMEPISKYYLSTKGEITGRAHAEALFELLRDIYLYDGLRSEIRYLAESGETTEAERFEQIWGLILEVLDQLVITLGDAVMNREEFGMYVRTGISKCEIRIIPSGIDRVYFGTAERNASADVKALFILGANDGSFPNDIKAEGYLSNSDRQCLNENPEIDLSLAPDTRGRMEKRRYNVFRTLTAATERLYISYAAQDTEGGQLGPSRLVYDILSRFPHVHTDDDVEEASQRIGVYIASPKVTVHKLIKSRADNSGNPVWDAVYSYYREKNLYPQLIDMIDEERSIARRFDTISPETAEELYGSGNIVYSASRLNTYAKCPYMYFMHYGLGIKERELWEIGAADVGTYAHSVIEGFCRAVEKGETDPYKKSERWKALTDEQREDILDELFRQTEKKIESSEISQRGKAVSVIRRMERVISNAADTVHSSLKNGKYTIAGEEQEIGMTINDRVSLKGIIDRLDIYAGGNYKGIRVIDYKTGATRFSITNILNGVDMQMVLYAAAAKEYYEQTDPNGVYRLTGIYYTHVRSDLKNQKLSDSESKMISDSENARRLDGMTFLENENNNEVLFAMDERLIDAKQSDFLNVKFKKDGTLHSNSRNHIKTFADGERLMDIVKDTAAGFDDEIRVMGIIKQNPYVEGNINYTCSYCEYSGICGIFEDIEARKPDKNKKL